jgi:hypothetical protein
MTAEYKTLRVPVEAWHDAKQAKEDHETWGEYIRRCSDNPPTKREFIEASAVAQLQQSSGTTELEATEIERIARAVAERLRG